MKLNVKVFDLLIMSLIMISLVMSASISSRLKKDKRVYNEFIKILNPEIDTNKPSDLEISTEFDTGNKVHSNVISGAPFGIILERIKNYFPQCRQFEKEDDLKNVKGAQECLLSIENANAEIEKVRKYNMNEAANYFKNLNISEVDYWEKFYILSNVVLRGHLKDSGKVENWKFDKHTNIDVPSESFINEAANKV